MTIREAIAGIDERKPNAIPDSIKIRWLEALDWEIYREVILTHREPGAEFSGYPESLTREESPTLLAPPPYDSMYLYCLESHMDYENGEIARYNNSAAMFRAVYDAYRNWYNRTHSPLSAPVRYY